MRPIVVAALLGGSSLLAAGRLAAQQTYEFSTVVELRNGIVAGEARLVGGGAIAFDLMAPNQVVEWFEIRDRRPGGDLVATTRRETRRPPSIEVVGLGQVLSDPTGSVGIAIDSVVELTLNVQDAGRLLTGNSPAFVVVGFDSGESAAFPILTGSPSSEAAQGAVITMEQPEDEDTIFMPIPDDGGAVVTVAPPEDRVVTGNPSGNAAGRVAVARTPPPGPTARPPVPPAQPRPQPPAQPAGPGPQPPTPPTAPQGPAAGGVAGTDWNATATALRGRNGERFVFRCPPGGTAGRGPWGGDVYADHSSVCTAAVHAGRMTFATGGSVTIEIRAGQDFYAASPGQGGVISSAAGGWPGSFAFVR